MKDFGSYEKLLWIKIGRTRNTSVCTERVHIIASVKI